MYHEFVLIKGFMLTWLLLVSDALSDPGAESFNSNFNRFRQKIPRIGRRGDGIIAEYMDSDSFPLEGSLSNFFLKASKAVPRLGRRKDISTESGRAAMFSEQYSLGDRHGLNRGANEVPVIGQKQDYWPDFNDLSGGTDKELIAQASRIPKDNEENYIHELIHSWLMNQNENINEN